MTQPESVLIDNSKEGLWGECDFLVRIILHITDTVILLHWCTSVVDAVQEYHKNTLCNSQLFISLLGFPLSNMIHQTAQITLFFYSSLHVIKGL
jgi:hypothetical protein